MDENRESHVQKDIHYHGKTAHLYDKVVSEPREFANELLFRPIDRMVPRRGTMLDLGCGTGQMLLRYARRFESAVGVDHSAEMLDVAKGRLGFAGIYNARLLQGDVIQFLESEQNQFDLISCVGCLHHLTNPDLERFFNLSSDKLKSGGALLIAEPIEVPAESMPAVIERWNRRSIMPSLASLLHLIEVEEADEGPLQLTEIRQLADNNRLVAALESRGWELFPHHIPAALSDRIVMRILHGLFHRRGNVFSALFRKA